MHDLSLTLDLSLQLNMLARQVTPLVVLALASAVVGQTPLADLRFTYPDIVRFLETEQRLRADSYAFPCVAVQG